ncbi:MAG TPA: PilZ domain-containing protein [Myxococcales bacterium]|nr:PilZ domain-containing protein [Myxococcales bacterium]
MTTRRRFPRAGVSVKVHLTVGDGPQRSFDAMLPSRDLSVSGVFFESTFFLKIGQSVDVSFRLPPQNRQVRARGRVVRVETLEEGSKPRTGFAVKFEEYYDSSDVVLANYFLAPALREFITSYASRSRLRLSDETVGLVVDVMSAWELEKMTESVDQLWREQP